MKKQRNLRTEFEIEQILDILRQVPKQELPSHFESQLKETIQAEAERIAAKKTPVRYNISKKRLKIALSLAACFMVGFLTLNMYNSSSDIGSVQKNTAEISSAVDAQEPEETASPKMAEARATFRAEAEKDALEPEKQLEEDVLVLEKRAEEEYSLKSEIPALQDDALDNLNGGSVDYEEQIRQYLDHAEFQIVSRSVDKDTQRITFEIMIISDKEGNPVNRPITLIGDGGTIYEQSQSKQPE